MNARKTLLSHIVLLSLSLPALAEPGLITRADSNEPSAKKNLFEMSIEELMEVPVVVSASRQEQKIGELSAPERDYR
jgi:hypothetical protein